MSDMAMHEKALERILALSEDNRILLGMVEDKWIPCSERVPSEQEITNNDGRFWVTVFEPEFQDPVTTEASYVFGKWSISGVVSWQPLPAPYQPKGE